MLFAQPALAEQAGFRPCRRCQPDHPEAPQVELVRRACEYIDAHLEEPLTLEVLGKQVGSSPYHLQRLFKQVTGITPRQYVEAARLGQFKTQLKEGENVTKALYE